MSGSDNVSFARFCNISLTLILSVSLCLSLSLSVSLSLSLSLSVSLSLSLSLSLSIHIHTYIYLRFFIRRIFYLYNIVRTCTCTNFSFLHVMTLKVQCPSTWLTSLSTLKWFVMYVTPSVKWCCLERKYILGVLIHFIVLLIQYRFAYLNVLPHS